MSYEQPHCPYCRDTGKKLTGEVHSDYLDCGHCGAAQERGDMEVWANNVIAINRLQPADPSLMWAIHARARDIAYAEIVRLSKERNQAEARIVSSTDAFKRIAQAHHAVLVAGNGDAGEIAKLADYLGLAPHIDAQAARIAELEAQIAAASEPALEQPIGHISKGMLEQLRECLGVSGYVQCSRTEEFPVAIYTAPQAADTDKLREALKLAVRQNSCDMLMTGEEIRKCEAALNSTALQAPVREVPEADLWELLPNDAWYLDPPDGGNVSLMEQLRRMSVDAAEWRKLARVGRAPKWISVSDKLPEFRHECTTSGCEVSDSILIYGETEFGTTGCGFGHARDDGTWQCYEAEYDQLTVSKVTHWMPLPAAPVQEPKP